MSNSSAPETEGFETLRVDAENAAEWIKSAAVSADQARRSLDRLDTLERNSPTVGQVARYGGIGALGGAAAGAIGNAIESGNPLRGATPKAKVLNMAASAAKGAIGGGALPLLRSHSDRHAEMGTLRKFMGQQEPPAGTKIGHAVVQLVKQAGLMDMARQAPTAMKALPGAAKSLMSGATPHMEHLNEIGGLGVLAVPSLDKLQAKARARFAGDRSEHAVEKRQLMGEGGHAALEVGGLGMLAGPAIARLKHAFANSNYAGNVAQNGPGMKSHSQLPGFTRPALAVKVSSPLKRVGELVTGSKAGKLRDAALRHADRAADGKLPRELKAARKLRGLARKEEHNVGKAQGALVGAAALGAASDSHSIHEKLKSKEAGVGVGAGMTTSQYSGPLSYGAFKMTSGIPPFKRTSATRNDESLEGAGWMTGQSKESTVKALVRLLGKEAASAAATGAMSPAASLNATQRVAGPKTTGFAGPSIADIAKPKGFGTPMPGAQKNQI